MLGVGLDTRPLGKVAFSLEDVIRIMFRDERETWDRMAWEGWKLNKKNSHLLSVEAVRATVLLNNMCEFEGDIIWHFVDPQGKYRLKRYNT
jgi:hypothetical protein